MSIFDDISTSLTGRSLEANERANAGGSQQTSQNQSTGSSFGQSGGLNMGSSFGQSSTGLSDLQSPYLQDLFSQAQGLLGNPSQYTGQAADLRAQRAMSGSPLNMAAGQGLQDTISGAYMPGGSRYQDISEALLNQIRPSVDSMFAGGRFGSGLHKQALAGQLSDRLIANSGQERQNMMNAMGMAPQQAQQDYGDINQLALAGQMPYQQLQQYQGLLGGPIMTSQAQNQAQNLGLTSSISGSQNQSTGSSQGTSQRGHSQAFGDIMGGIGGGM